MRRPEFLARHGRRPEGRFGRVLAKLMAWETSKENDAALDLLEIRPGDRVLEIGFGHGRSIDAASRLARGGLVAGVDFSPSMVAMARRRNRALVDQQIVDLRQGNSLCLPFEDDSFDRAWSVHTVYFWDEPVAHMKEVRRVIKDGGRFVLGFRPASEEARRAFPASVYTFRPAEQIRQMLLAAGFHPVTLVDRGASTRGITFAVASTAQHSAINDPVSNACQRETSP
jgi:SAM-dependent methyltransferase